jgi:hypothetical protein
MSVFDKDGNPVEGQAIESYLAELVGEDRKFKTPEELAKGKFEADKFVEDLKRQNEELRKDLEEGTKLDELMKLIKEGQKSPEAPGGQQVPSETPGGTSPEPLTEEKLRALVENHVSQRESETQRQRNISAVDQEMNEKFGDSAHAVLVRRAAELDMTLEEAQELAASKPKAFIRLMGLDSKGTTPSPVTIGNTQRSEGGNFNRSGTTRDWAYYQDMRRNKKSLYFSPAVQQQLIKDRLELGDKFGMPT